MVFQMTAPRTRLPSLSFSDETDSPSVARRQSGASACKLNRNEKSARVQGSPAVPGVELAF